VVTVHAILTTNDLQASSTAAMTYDRKLKVIASGKDIALVRLLLRISRQLTSLSAKTKGGSCGISASSTFQFKNSNCGGASFNFGEIYFWIDFNELAGRGRFRGLDNIFPK
jgi:hypothetical protein